jgi:outer membrane protein OmpA-like peptidoglycan-associated protein
MRKNRLFALTFGVLLVVALVAQPANAQTNQNQNNGEYPKAGFFLGAGMSRGIFLSDKMSVYSDFDILQLNPAKIGAYYELPLGIGNFFAGLEAGFASKSLFGGGGNVDFLPINLNATFAFGIADILYIGPVVKLGVLGLLGHDEYKFLPLLGAGLDLELRYKYFPLSIYAQGGVNAFPTTYSFSVLPTVEVGLRFPRGAFGGTPPKENASSAPQTGGAQAVAQGGAGAQPEASASAAAPPAAAPTAPTVTSLTVTPATATINQGATQQFNAQVIGTNNPPQTVTWSVIGGGAGTSISPTGLLTVGPNETPGTPLTVRATSTADTTRSGTAAVTVAAASSQLVPPGAAAPTVTTPPSTAPTVTSLTVTPATATVNQGATQQFNAQVIGTNSPPQTVTWSVIGGGAGTSISPTGLLTVGPNETPGTPLTVRATSTADTTRSGTAAVTVAAASSQLVPPAGTTPSASTVTGIVVNPVTSIVPQGLEQHFTAIVEGTNNPPQTVTWSVIGGGTGTSINQNGLLTVSPNQAPGTLTVRATSTADTSRSGTSTVTVPVPAPAAVPTVSGVTVIPGIITVPQGTTQQFNAQVAGTNNPPQTVTWTVNGGAAGTSISPTGLLTVGANQAPGTLTVRATSTADTSRSGTATVTVPAPASSQLAPPATATTPPPAAATTPPSAQVIPPPAPAPTGRRDIMDTSKHSLFAEIHFEPDTAILIESGRPQLEAAGRYLQANPGMWILVRTYTAPFGTADGRFMVALERARFCRDYLLQNFGISPERIIVETLA